MIRALAMFAGLVAMTGLVAQTARTNGDVAPCGNGVEPDFTDVFYRLDGCKLIPLERQAAIMHYQAHGFIVMTTKSAAEFPGSKSPIRFSKGLRLDLVVRILPGRAVSDPNMFYSLHRLNVTTKTRELVRTEGHVSPIGVSTKTDLSGTALPVDFSRYGTSSLKMSTAELSPGEYAVGRTLTTGLPVFCFGVD